MGARLQDGAPLTPAENVTLYERVFGAGQDALTVRRAETMVELGSGQSFAIAGLLQDNVTQSDSAVPFMGEVPVLGALFLPGSGGGVVNPNFAALVAKGDRGSDNPQASPRIVMNSFYFKPPFTARREGDLPPSLLSGKIGPAQYPRDPTPPAPWALAPGSSGARRARSPGRCRRA